MRRESHILSRLLAVPPFPKRFTQMEMSGNSASVSADNSAPASPRIPKSPRVNVHINHGMAEFTAVSGVV